MSTRGTTFWDEGAPMEWTPEPRPWCASCCVPHCGCPEAEAAEDLRAQHYDGMGVE